MPLSPLLPSSLISLLPSKFGSVFLCKSILLQNFFLVLIEFFMIFLELLSIGLNSITVIQLKAIIIDLTFILISKLLLILFGNLGPIFRNLLIDLCRGGVLVLFGVLMISFLDEASIGQNGSTLAC